MNLINRSIRETHLNLSENNNIIIVNSSDDLHKIINSSSNKTILLSDGNYSALELGKNVKNIKIKSKNQWKAIFEGKGGTYCIAFNDTSYNTIEGVSVTNCSIGMVAKDSHDCSFRFNQINFSDLYGIYIKNSSKISIENNLIYSKFNQSVAIKLKQCNYSDIISNIMVIPGKNLIQLNESYTNTLINGFSKEFTDNGNRFKIINDTQIYKFNDGVLSRFGASVVQIGSNLWGVC